MVYCNCFLSQSLTNILSIDVRAYFWVTSYYNHHGNDHSWESNLLYLWECLLVIAGVSNPNPYKKKSGPIKKRFYIYKTNDKRNKYVIYIIFLYWIRIRNMVRSRVHITLLLYIVDVLFTSRVGLSAIHRSLGVATNRDNSGRKYYTTHCRSWSIA